ncbi:MAG: hypothetical protein JEZ03_13515, partial [Bacteroidales bacterium]|nr:hypothetical protein [Bacteroidales bacterium]
MELLLNVTYEYNSDIRILFKYHYGVITLEDIRSTWEYAISNKLIPKEVNGFILDYSKASFGIKIEDYVEIPNFYKEHLDVFANTRIAIVT